MRSNSRTYEEETQTEGGKQGIRAGCRGEERPCGPHYFPAVNFTRIFSHPSAVDWREECFVVETKRALIRKAAVRAG